MFGKLTAIACAFLIVSVAGSIPIQYIETIRYPGDTGRHVQEIKGAKVSKQLDASGIATTAYEKKTKKGGFAGRTNIEVLAFDIPGFGKRGDKVWEVRFTEVIIEKGAGGWNATIAILWVHSETTEVYFVIGPWVAEEKKE